MILVLPQSDSVPMGRLSPAGVVATSSSSGMSRLAENYALSKDILIPTTQSALPSNQSPSVPMERFSPAVVLSGVALTTPSSSGSTRPAENDALSNDTVL